jgi:hypothetical protein
MIEACNRLGQKLDEVTDLFRQQIEAWRQIGPPAAAHSAGGENTARRAAAAGATERASVVEQRPVERRQSPRAETQENRREDKAGTASAPTAQGGQEREQRRDAAATLPADAGTTNQQRRDDAVTLADGSPADAGTPNQQRRDAAATLAEMLTRSGGGWTEQVAGVQQALEAIMAHLENLAANAAPKFDPAGILSRLSDLEEQQKDLQSQFNTNR